MNPNNTFTSIGLKLIREEAKRLGVKIPQLSTWADKSMTNSYYEVWSKGEIIWRGSAYNASEAKSRAISKLIEKKTLTSIHA